MTWPKAMVVTTVIHIGIIVLLLASPRSSLRDSPQAISGGRAGSGHPVASRESAPADTTSANHASGNAAPGSATSGNATSGNRTSAAGSAASAVRGASGSGSDAGTGAPTLAGTQAPAGPRLSLDGYLTPVQIEMVEKRAGTARETLAQVGNHLWQSTVCLVLAALLTLTLKRNAARVRYAIWIAASLKFLVPFAPLIAFGRQLGWKTAADGPPTDVTILMDAVSRPFSRPATDAATTAVASHAIDVAAMLPLVLLALWALGTLATLATWFIGWRRIARVVRAAAPMQAGTELQILRRLERRVGIRTPTPIVASNTSLEPGVFGLTRPVLLWPRGITERLTADQIEALLAHEVCHIRRRDNVIAAIHMGVEALFWFHPLVWWIESRLVDERERACDEEVVRWGHEPVVYAESILKTCQFYAEPPLPCVAGITGSDLKKRIEAIMRHQTSTPLGPWKALLLGTIGVATIAAPITIGTVNAPVRAQVPTLAPPATYPAFEAASIKQNTTAEPGDWRLQSLPGGRISAVNATAASIIRFAYDVPVFLMSGGPDWLRSDRFDLSAKAEGDPPVDQKRLMLRRLLAERLKLTVHTEKRELDHYALVMNRADGRLGRGLRKSDADCLRSPQSTEPGIGPPPPNGVPGCDFFGFSSGTNFAAGKGGISFRGVSMPALAKIFVPMVRRSVIDQTGLSGFYDADFDFIAELPIPPPPPGMPAPQLEPFVSMFTVLPEQLGLKLDSRRGPIDVLVIDRAEPPTPD